MTLTQAVLGFTLLAAVVTVTPGLDTVLVLRQALRGRRAVAFAAGLGICVGCLVWGVAAATGLAALFVASQTAYLVLNGPESPSCSISPTAICGRRSAAIRTSTPPAAARTPSARRS